MADLGVLDLPAPGGALLGGCLGDILLRPWFDALALPAVTRGFFPLSRAWAAANLAGASPERFLVEADLPAAALGRVGPALARLAARRRAHDAAAAAWEDAFFAAAAAPDGRLAEIEAARMAAAQTWMNGRRLFLPLHLRHPFPAVRWQLPGEAEVAARHGARLARPEAAFPAPPLPAIKRSHSVRRDPGAMSWLRFPACVGGAPDTAWARVVTPPGRVDPPTLIFLHGIGVETEFWRADLACIDRLAASGIRIVRPQGPWHGRRRREGWYGGEPIMAQGPLGLLDLVAAWVAEVAILIAWARATSRGPVGLGGISLGAFVSQIAATAADWPAALRPDALLLIGTTGAVADAALAGSLGRALGVAPRLAERSWSAAALRRWAPLLEPRGAPALPSSAIAMLIGTRDTVAPTAGGLALARRWRVPAENLFLRRQGHFSVALGLERDAAPLARLAAILQAMR